MKQNNYAIKLIFQAYEKLIFKTIELMKKLMQFKTTELMNEQIKFYWTKASLYMSIVRKEIYINVI